MEWTPPKGTKVVFAFDFDTATSKLRGAAWRRKRADLEKHVAALAKKHQMRPKENGVFYKLSIEDKRLPLILDDLRKSRKRGLAGLGSCWLEEPPASAKDPDAWFGLLSAGPNPKTLQSIPDDCHFKAWYPDETLESRLIATAALKKVIEKSKLTGLNWLPLVESHPKDSVQWHEFYPTHFLGKGVDHVLFDHAKEDARWKKQELDPCDRGAHDIVGKDRMIRGVRLKPDVLQEFRKEASGDFSVRIPIPYVKEHLPPTDFAYGQEFPWIFVSPRAKQVLSATGWFKPWQFEPIKVIARSECVTPIVDEVSYIKKPAPRYSPKQYEAQSKKRAQQMKLLKAKKLEKIVRTRSQAQQLIKKSFRSDPWPVAQKQSEWAAINRRPLFKQLPKMWQELAPQLPLAVLQGRDEEQRIADFEMVPPQWNRQTYAGGSSDDAPSRKDIVFARNAFGDWFAVRSTSNENDERIVITRWDHETLAPAEQWHGVPHFVSWIIERWKESKPADD